MADLLLLTNISNEIIKAKSNFKKSPKDRITLSYVEVRLETLDQQWSVFLEHHHKAVGEGHDPGKDYDYEKTEEEYIDYKSLLKEKLSILKPKPIVSNITSQVNKGSELRSNVRLPEISIPKFSGHYSEWVSFRDMFVSVIDNNSSLDDVQKLHYLKGCLSGEAEQLLKHLPLTASNYKICWSQLENRYNNKKYLSNCILKRLTGQRVLTSESSSGLKQLLDTTRECLHSLDNLGIKTNTWDVLIIFLVSQKLDSESRKLWERTIAGTNQELPKFKEFEEFLENRFRSLEFLDTRVQKSNCTHLTTAVLSCIFCSDNHKLCNCKKFAKETIDSRRDFVQAQHLCFNCLNSGHSVYQCTMSTRCRLCKKKHHTLLHPKSTKSVSDKTDQSVDKAVVATVTETVSKSQTPTSSETNDYKVFTTCVPYAHSQVLLATALVNVQSNKFRTPVVLRSLLDQGSQASFITESAVQLLGLKKMPGTNLVSGLGGDQGMTVASKSTVLIKIQSRLDPTFVITVKAHVLNKVTTLLPTRKVSVKITTAFSSMALADPSFDTPNKIDLLLGAEVYSQILLDGLFRGSPGSVIAQNTKLGWILSGRTLGQVSQDENCHNIIVNMHTQLNDSDNNLLKKFWELEAEPSSIKGKMLSEEEKLCEDFFSQTTKRDFEGRYIVKLPFKSADLLCNKGDSERIAYKRFLTLEKRLTRNPDLKIDYSKVIQEYLDMNHMAVVDDSKSPGVYIPHHVVIRKDKTTTKNRVVFDASCTDSNGVSLNSELMVGPALQPELRHLIMRWRSYPISLVADIVKMYRQVKVAEEDTDFQRILWREEPDSELQHFRLLRVTFGLSCAPYLAVRALQQLAYDEGPDFPLACPRVLNDFYMDDLLTGCQSVSEGVEIYEQMTKMLYRGGFPLQKWSTNSKELASLIKQTNDDEGPDLELKTDDMLKILGLAWDRDSDEFRCIVTLPPIEHPVTKRKVISDIARLYDPLGWIAPAITTAKVFIQKLWLSGIEWDAALPSSLLTDWITFRDDLSSLKAVRILRWINTSNDNQSVELHGFSDASNVAYAAVVYIRIIDQDEKIHVHLITSKTRVAPIKQVSIPRLELCGAVLLAKLLNEVAEILGVPKTQLHAWTDSTIVLAWLRSHPSRWKTFIANRVSEILTITDANQWSHVGSQDNPADSASRGLLPSECAQHQLWKEGPKWLYESKLTYDSKVVTDTNLEEKKHKIKCHATCESTDGYNLISRFSSLSKLTRVLSYCRRILSWNKPENKGRVLTAKELNEALLTCIKICQGHHFSKEINSLKMNGIINKKSKLTSLSPFLDSDGVLRVGGRLHHAHIKDDMKHSIIIPHKSHFTYLLISQAHEMTLHGGPQLMLNYLRSKYWIVGAKSLVRQFVRKCVTCLRYSAQPTQPYMGQLPVSRVTAHRPFLKSGVDYAGPINIRVSKGRGHRSTKGYICLFICMATKAIHLEVVSDMTSQGFLAAFKRFVARRGHVVDLWSDNGTNFVGSARELKELFNEERSKVAIEIASWLASNHTNWHFIPPHSPNFGGLWESGIKSTKHHLKRVVGNSTLTFEEMTTTLSQIEACLNSRPISQISYSPEDPCPLTPGHFLVGEPLVLVPEVNYESSNISTLKRWHLTQRMVQDFWRRWSQEYLTQLQHRYKWNNQTKEPEIGDVVLVKEDDLPPARWLFGRITDKHTGSDNVTRVVTLKYKDNSIKRPVSKLIILPVKDND